MYKFLLLLGALLAVVLSKEAQNKAGESMKSESSGTGNIGAVDRFLFTHGGHHGHNGYGGHGGYGGGYPGYGYPGYGQGGYPGYGGGYPGYGGYYPPHYNHG